MTLYKFLTTERSDILETGHIRYTQPAYLNDPFEMRLNLSGIITGKSLLRFSSFQTFAKGIKDVQSEIPRGWRWAVWISELYRASDNAHAFKEALEDRGYILAKGDKRDFVIIDRQGGEHNLVRRIEGMRAAELREFMSPIERDALPSVKQARDAQIERASGQRTPLDQLSWEDKVAESGIEKFKRDEAKQKEEWRAKRLAQIEKRREVLIGMRYGQGDDVLHQTNAAWGHIEAHRKFAERNPKPMAPEVHSKRSNKKERRTLRDANETAALSVYERMKRHMGDREITDSRGRMLDRLSERETPDGIDFGWQPSAPGGGRARSR